MLLVSTAAVSQSTDQNQLLQVVKEYCKTSAVSGREEEASAFIKSLFSSGELKTDKLGNLTMTFGSGNPKKLFVAPLDEPGYVVSQIQEDGYLRLSPLGLGQGTMFHQFLQGNEIKINTATGNAFGVAVVPSTHYEGLRANPERNKTVYQWQDGYVDVGATSANEVNQSGIRLLDPVTANKIPQIINGGNIAAVAARSKSAAIALAAVARTLKNEHISGTVVIAFVTLELLNGKGLDDVINQYGPFDKIVRFNRYKNGKDEAIAILKPSLKTSGNTEVIDLGLPASFVATPVEMVNINDINVLALSWLKEVQDRNWNIAPLPDHFSSVPKSVYTSFIKEQDELTRLIAAYGVAGAEKPVHDLIVSRLPAWAHPATDAKGNIILTFGQGVQHIAFIAHMDEVGYVVDSIYNDGRLGLKQRGGFFNSIWEGHAALIHTNGKDITGLFEPRSNYLTAVQKMNGTNAPVVFAGFLSKQDAIRAGIIEGVTTVTMPKKMIRLSQNRATARGFDDRAGCASLLLALQKLDPKSLPFKVTFLWSVEEEVGLNGATFAAKNLSDVAMVYPIDTFVSSDEPVDSKIFGNCPLGNGAVIRVLESVNYVRRKDLKYIQEISKKNNIKIQYGMTAGGTDGQEFLRYDIPSVPLSWPGRYSHSPIEVLDFRDIDNLVKLIVALSQDKQHLYKD